MTTPAPPPDEFPRELLAAYADGELDAAARERVERWLADHPEALDELHAQRELSPANAPLWERAEPREPSDAEWAVARRGIDDRLSAAVSGASRWRVAAWALAGLATAGVAAAVAWVALAPNNVPPPRDEPKAVELVQAPPAGSEVAPHPREVAGVAPAPAPRSLDPLAAFAVLPMATDDDVILDRVPNLQTGWLPVGRHPLPGLLILATEDEVHLAGVAPSPAWPTGGPKMTTAPGDAPMIYAAKLR
jgi:hypothetical protein